MHSTQTFCKCHAQSLTHTRHMHIVCRNCVQPCVQWFCSLPLQYHPKETLSLFLPHCLREIDELLEGTAMTAMTLFWSSTSSLVPTNLCPYLSLVQPTSSPYLSLVQPTSSPYLSLVQPTSPLPVSTTANLSPLPVSSTANLSPLPVSSTANLSPLPVSSTANLSPYRSLVQPTSPPTCL